MNETQKLTFSQYFSEMCDMTNYSPLEPKTHYGETLVSAEGDNVPKMRETYCKLLKDAKTDYRKMTEFVLILNWLSWYHYESGDLYNLSAYYSQLYASADEVACTLLKGEELQHYLRTLD